MSAGELIINKSSRFIENILSACRLCINLIKKKKPLTSIWAAIVNEVKNILTANKKLKIARYRVSHLRYRFYQMETLIKENNPNNTTFGSKMNHLR